jgi:riboflavin synthase
MFTGIIEELGTVAAEAPRLRVMCAAVLSDLTEGASIAVNGVCLTALNLGPDSFEADLAPETLERSNLGDLRIGSRVNLERPVTPATRLSGHIVQGHVDAAGEIAALEQIGGGNWWLKVRIPAALDRYLVHKGSIAIDGISLTVANLATDVVEAAIIPFTYANTNLQALRPGDAVNIEADILAKYLERLLETRRPAAASTLTLERLVEEGF